MPRKTLGETYVWDPPKEKRFLQKLDDFLSSNDSKQPTIQIYKLWANEFNSEFGGVPAHGGTLYQKKERMKKIYHGWKFLQSRTGLGYDPVTDRVICSDEAWQSFIKVNNECNHLRHEGLRNKDLYYNVFEKIMLSVPLRLGQLRWEVAILHPPTLIYLWTTPEHIRFSRRKSILSTVGCKAPQDDGPMRQVRLDLGEVLVRGNKETQRKR
ncbi:hypothetical protein TIFTF001_042238 [Ficus carica]|uniref:Myb/SANT-like domain-containing protein n=1 Tax=Ficus carica TaxID=3494 RepID=A0AA88CUL3_FICCA|nr:hypothetical protein TIFTF001_042238 [Ficus carica]